MNILTAFPVKGFLFTLLLFTLCLIGVQVAMLTHIGWIAQHPAKPLDEKPKEEEKKLPAQDSREPIYYIVERKTRRAKPSYGEPKQINFKP